MSENTPPIQSEVVVQQDEQMGTTDVTNEVQAIHDSIINLGNDLMETCDKLVFLADKIARLRLLREEANRRARLQQAQANLAELSRFADEFLEWSLSNRR